MASLHPLFAVTAVVLLCGVLTDAQDAIRNFQVANRNSTHITFSWDIVDGYYTSTYISYFQIHYWDRFGSSSTIYITYSNTQLIKSGSSFQYSTAMTSFRYSGQNVMWLEVYRSSRTPRNSYSEQIYVEVGQNITMELNIQLWPFQTCLAFTEQNIGTSQAVQNEVLWFIRKHCQCKNAYLQSIRMYNAYFTCASGGYVTFRATFHSTGVLGPASLKSTLTTWLYGQDTDKTIAIYGRRFSVEPGPCGVTVPDLNAPTCSSPAATQAVGTSMPTSAASAQDNTAVIVASVFAAMFFILCLGLIGYILAARRHQTTRSTGARVAKKTTRPSTAPAQAATRREQPKMHAKQECEVETRYYPNQDEIYTEMDDF